MHFIFRTNVIDSVQRLDCGMDFQGVFLLRIVQIILMDTSSFQFRETLKIFPLT